MNQLLTPNQIATLLNCKPSSVYSWAKAGRIPAYKLNGLLRFDSQEIEEWIRGARLQAKDAEKEARKVLKSAKGKRTDIDRMIKNTIASVKGREYNPHQRGSQTSQARKGGKNGTLQKRQGLVDEF